GESALTVVMIKKVGSRGQPSRTADNRHALPHTVSVAPLLWSRCRIKVDIAGHKQVEFAVAIVADKRTARAPIRRLLYQPRFFSDVDKFPFAGVPVEDVLPIVGHEYVIIAVVIKIADTHSLAPPSSHVVCALSDVGKRSVPVVVVKVVG